MNFFLKPSMTENQQGEKKGIDIQGEMWELCVREAPLCPCVIQQSPH